MIRNRTFMMGLGIGLVLGAILLQLMIIGEGKQTQEDAAANLTREQLIAAAEAMNLQVVERSEDEEGAGEEADAASGTSEGEAEAAPVNPPAPEEPEAPQQPEQPDEAQSASTQAGGEVSPPSEPKPPAEEPIKLVVVRGSMLADVAEDLLQAGIIEDKQAFIARASSRNINRRVQTGTYSFKAGEDFDTIISELTKPSN
ncbi:endolytic transglycosylase MltG [Paenibacillus campinasensis]|uniref:Aminodeoxychorismate lyase n=1 Tax=Paenibacillus campinasensis TaxID=66347 RepID=A0A268ES42_9BACL|nr:endolytic transglycosylase MltG [Paenibacillus campinasensis]PAD75952.1 hypothetical protein CHH67_13490 [Paenibacillus campinasensis]